MEKTVFSMATEILRLADNGNKFLRMTPMVREEQRIIDTSEPIFIAGSEDSYMADWPEFNNDWLVGTCRSNRDFTFIPEKIVDMVSDFWEEYGNNRDCYMVLRHQVLTGVPSHLLVKLYLA